ncbi:MAG TPA: hypothetical protein VF435_09630, partial [Pyrinomonadaceae bacterium]
DLTSQPISIRLTNATLIYALERVSMDYRIPIGIECSPDDKKEAVLNIDTSNGGTLTDVLNLIVEQVPIYRWEVRDGVINIVPNQSRDQFLVKLLSTHIDRFAPKPGITKFDIRNTLADLPEVHSLLEANKITVFKYGDYVYYPSIYTKEVDLSISDTDVRGVLNKVVRDSEHKLWVVGWRDEKKDSLTISF